MLINQFMQSVEIYRRDGEDGPSWSYAFYGPGSTIELLGVDVCMSMADIYKGVNFDEPLVED